MLYEKAMLRQALLLECAVFLEKKGIKSDKYDLILNMAEWMLETYGVLIDNQGRKATSNFAVLKTCLRNHGYMLHKDYKPPEQVMEEMEKTQQEQILAAKKAAKAAKEEANKLAAEEQLEKDKQDFLALGLSLGEVKELWAAVIPGSGKLKSVEEVFEKPGAFPRLVAHMKKNGLM